VHSVCSSDSRDGETAGTACSPGKAVADIVRVRVKEDGRARRRMESGTSLRLGAAIVWCFTRVWQSLSTPSNRQNRHQMEGVRAALSSCTKQHPDMTWPKAGAQSTISIFPGRDIGSFLWLVCMPKMCLGGIGAGHGRALQHSLHPCGSDVCLHCRHGRSLPVC
jgi:hypothetical protein